MLMQVSDEGVRAARMRKFQSMDDDGQKQQQTYRIICLVCFQQLHLLEMLESRIGQLKTYQTRTPNNRRTHLERGISKTQYSLWFNVTRGAWEVC